MEIKADELRSLLKSDDKKFLVEFYATWCGPCKVLKPIFTKVAENNTTEVKLYTFDVDSDRDLCVDLGIRSVPVTKSYKGGEMIDSKLGVISEGQINQLIQNLLENEK